MMKPLAKTNTLLVREAGSHLMILDEADRKCYCLNQFTANIWHKCNGRHTVEDIANQLNSELKIVSDENEFKRQVQLEVEWLKQIQLI